MNASLLKKILEMEKTSDLSTLQSPKICVVASQEPHARNSCLPKDATDPSILKPVCLHWLQGKYTDLLKMRFSDVNYFIKERGRMYLFQKMVKTLTNCGTHDNCSEYYFYYECLCRSLVKLLLVFQGVLLFEPLYEKHETNC